MAKPNLFKHLVKIILRSGEILRQQILAWVFLIISIGCDIVWGSTLPITEGYSRLGPSIVNITSGGLGVVFLSQCLKLLPLTMAYPLCISLGAAGVALCGITIYHEYLDIWQTLSIALIVVGVVGLKLASSEEDASQEAVKAKEK